jgi:hypothetical protein
VSGRPLLPVGRAVCLGLVAAGASRSALAAAVVWLAVLAAVYAADPGPALTAMAVTAVALFPIAAWLGAALLHAVDRGLRAVVVAALGRGRALLADALTCLLAVAAAGVLGVLAAVLFDPTSPTAGEALVGLALHLVCGAAGVGLALLLHGWGLPRGVQAVVVLLCTLVSGRLRWLPPEGPVLSTWATGALPGPAGTALAVGGAVAVAVLLTAGAALARRR